MGPDSGGEEGPQLGTRRDEATSQYREQVARGAELLREGVTRFADWSKLMLAEFGERIQPHLTRLYFEAKTLLGDNRGSSSIELEAFAKLAKAIGKTRHPFAALGRAVRQSWAGQLAEIVASPLGSRLEREGEGAGKALMEDLRRASENGEIAAGGRLLRLADAKMHKLTRDQLFNLLDALEGRAKPADDQVRQAADVARDLLDEIGGEAEDLEVYERYSGGRRLMRRMRNYFPHMIRRPEALRRGPVRRDVLDNIVRLRIKPDRAAAEAFLDEYLGWVEGGGRLRQILDHLIETGQAADEAEAMAKMQRERKHIQRHGSLEYAREVDLPFYDPNPYRVLPTHVATASIRLAQIAELGQEDEGVRAPVVNRHLKAIADAGGNPEWAGRAVDRILGWINRADEKERKAVRFLLTLQGWKLGLAAIPNATQTLNTLLAADLPALAAGVGALFSTEGKRFAVQAGATIDPILHESVRELAGSSRALERYLRAVGFTPVERMNRVIAANAGAVYARRLLDKLKRNPGNRRARAALEELGIDATAALGRGALSAEDVLMAAKKLSDLTQFRARPEDVPEFASTPWGKVFFQFKTFSYQQARFLQNQIAGEIKRGDYGRGFRNLLILGTLFPLTG